MPLYKIIYVLSAFLLAFAGSPAILAGGSCGKSDAYKVLDSISGVSTPRLVADGDRLFSEGDYESALKVFTVVCRRYDSDIPVSQLAYFTKAFNRYGNILYKKGAYSLAMDSYLQMRRIAEENDMGGELAVAYVRIGNIYAASGDYDSATDFYKRALAVPEISGNCEDVYQMALNNMFASSLLSGNIAGARKFLGDYRDKFGGDGETARHAFDISLGEGLIAQESGDYELAITHYRKALKCAVENHLDPLCEGSVRSCMGEVYKRIGMADSALNCLRKALEIARTAGNGRLTVESLRDMADFYESRNMRDSANFYKAACLNLADSISYKEEINKLKSSQMLYELDKSEFTIRSLNSEKKAQATVIWVVAVAVVVCAAFAVGLFIQNRKLRAAWVDLYERSSRQLKEELNHKHVAACQSESDGGLDKNSEAGGELSSRKMMIDSELSNEIAAAVTRYMDTGDGYCDVDFSLDKLASEIGYNPRYVSEVINVVFQKNFRTLLNEYRIRKAMLRLHDTEHYGNYTIKAISESVGYKSQATFISVFTKITGLKPGIYQKLSRQNNPK